jgi:hypothetical protein
MNVVKSVAKKWDEGILSMATSRRMRIAQRFLMEQLRDQPRDLRLLARRAAAEGISRLTLRRAARTLCVKMEVTGFGTMKRSVWSIDHEAMGSLKEQRKLLEKEISRIVKWKDAAESEEESIVYHKIWSALRGIR